MFREILSSLTLNNYRTITIIGILGALSIGIYILFSWFTFRIGFPLDDAWIHQTYARNFAQGGEWAFISGQPSAGSTAPLWSGLLALGFIFNLGPYAWTFFLGWLFLVALALLGRYTFLLLCPDHKQWAIWVGILLLFEWHLVWSSASGMETLLFALMVLLVITWLVAGWAHWFLLGIVIGISVWVRPDGITLLGPALLVMLLIDMSWKQRFLAATNLLIGFMLLFVLYIIFNRLLTSAWWPNTFYAKQAEYAIELNDPLWVRVIEQAMLPLIGVGFLLLPGFIGYLRVAVADRNWPALSGAFWAIGYLLLYALRLPVTYQHGRYVIPMMPVYFLWGFAGMVLMIQPYSKHTLRRVLSRAWLLSIGFVLIIFWMVGARAYSRDVAIIESEMVDTARWIEANTQSDTLIAAHDIGALGYYGERDILDLAGLVSPEVIPFIRDEHQLAVYLNERGADFLVTFPGWYPNLVEDAELKYSTDGNYSPLLGGENMQVYKWPSNDYQ